MGTRVVFIKRTSILPKNNATEQFADQFRKRIGSLSKSIPNNRRLQVGKTNKLPNYFLFTCCLSNLHRPLLFRPISRGRGGGDVRMRSETISLRTAKRKKGSIPFKGDRDSLWIPIQREIHFYSTCHHPWASGLSQIFSSPASVLHPFLAIYSSFLYLQALRTAVFFNLFTHIWTTVFFNVSPWYRVFLMYPHDIGFFLMYIYDIGFFNVFARYRYFF